MIPHSDPLASSMTMLLVSPLESDHRVLKSIFSRSNWHLHSAFSRGEALALIRNESIPVIICVDHLRDGDWKRLLEDAAQTPNSPRLIVTSRMANDSLWAEVLQAGAYDFLAMPWEPREVLRLASLAWKSWAVEWRSFNVSPKPVKQTCSLVRAAGAGSAGYPS